MERPRPLPEDVQFSAETHDLFMNHLKRSPAWIIRRDQITVHPHSPTKSFTISPQDLQNEYLSPELASTIFSFKWIEDKLPDYALLAIAKSRKYHGITEFYYQWGFEESQHSQGEDFILEHTGSRTRYQMEQEYLVNQQNPYVPPYEDPGMCLFFTLFQEGVTHEDYTGIADTARAEGAVNVATILDLIGEDEAYHYGGLRSFVKLFVKHDPKGSKKDALEVAANFRIPAASQLLNPWRERSAIIKAGGYKPKMLLRVLSQTLTDAFGASQEEIKEVFSHHKGRIY